jgi:hypothetical protein
VKVDTGSNRAMSHAMLGPPDGALLLGEAGARTVTLPSGPRR